MGDGSVLETFVCSHERTVEAGSHGLPECEADVRALMYATTGEEREAGLRFLLEGALCTKFTVLHEVAEHLIGRPVWTHEFARPENLYREARTQDHPADLEAHVIGSLDQLAGDKPVLIVRPE